MLYNAVLFVNPVGALAPRHNMAYRRLVTFIRFHQLLGVLMPKLGIRCARRAVSGMVLTDFGRAACVSLLLVLSCVLSPAFAQATEGCAPAVGSGTSSSPYRIATLCELQGISLGPAAHYELVANIDASRTKDWNYGEGFEPIASGVKNGFSGSFVNAGTHTISSLTINRRGTDSVGLFSRLATGAIIRGVTLVGSSTVGKDAVGALAGVNLGSIENCYAMGSVSGSALVGGLVGGSGGNINNGYAMGLVSGGDSVGGLVGYDAGGNINNSYVSSTVTGQSSVGGLVGEIEGNISSSCARGLVSGDRSVGGLVGRGFGNIDRSCARGSVVGISASTGGLVGRSVGDISNSSATGSVFGKVNSGGLVGSSSGDIRDSYATGSVSGDSASGGLVGTLSGSSIFPNAPSISGSYATGRVRSSRAGVGGLVGIQTGDTIISDSYATGSVFGISGDSDNIGGLVGESGGDISNSYATGSVSGQGEYVGGLFTGGSSVGGLVGFSSALIKGVTVINGEISGSHATGSVSGNERVGGLVGRQGYRSRIISSHATGSVSGNYQVGGLVGGFYSSFTRNGDISNSFATGSVTGEQEVGGLAGGVTLLDINNSYATGSVFGRGDSVGGLVGYQGGYSNVINSYATGFVSGSFVIGGLVGYQADRFSIRNSYYAARGQSNGLGEERTFAQLRCPTAVSRTCPSDSTDTYRGWDTSIWDFGSARDLPQLLGNKNPDLNRKPYIKGSTELVVVGFTGITRFSLEAGYLGFPEDPAIFTWSLFGVPPSLRNLVYFDLDGTSGTEANGSVATLSVVGDMRLAGKSFDVVLTNNIFDNVGRLPVRILGVSPLVVGGTEQTETIWDGSPSAVLSFSAIDRDSPDSDGAGLSWDFLSRDDLAEGSTVEFSGSQKGGIVNVEVRRDSLDPVGSFVLEVESPVGVKSRLTVTVETVCSAELGKDLMAGQAGSGELNDPYQIKRLCQLQDVRSSPTAHYELVGDIDARKSREWNSGAGFEPIASDEENGFSGSFVSTSTYKIRSLAINRSRADNVGLFSKLANGAAIRGVRLVGSRTVGRDSVGSLVGRNEGVIEDCSATGFVSGGDGVGGLVGRNEEGASVSRSYAANTVAGQSNVGGLVGFQATASSIRDSYATGSASGSGYVGGLVGFQATASSIRDSYATGSAFGQGSSVGGLVGGRQGLSLSVGNSYYVARGRSNGLGKERTFEQLRCPTMASVTCPPGSLESTYEGWNPGVWDFGTADELPQLLSNFNPGLSRKLLRVKMYLGGAVR